MTTTAPAPGPTLADVLDAATKPDAPRGVVIKPEQGSRLEQLSAEYDNAKAALDTATKALKTITDGIKLELATLAPGERAVDLSSEHLARPLRLSAVESWRVDAKKLKAEAPETYVRYAVQSTAWVLKTVNG